jgi:hypothetical protein
MRPTHYLPEYGPRDGRTQLHLSSIRPVPGHNFNTCSSPNDNSGCKLAMVSTLDVLA